MSISNMSSSNSRDSIIIEHLLQKVSMLFNKNGVLCIRVNRIGFHRTPNEAPCFKGATEYKLGDIQLPQGEHSIALTQDFVDSLDKLVQEFKKTYLLTNNKPIGIIHLYSVNVKSNTLEGKTTKNIFINAHIV